MFKKIISIAMIVTLLLVAVATVAFGAHTPKSYSSSVSVKSDKTSGTSSQSGSCTEGDAIHYKTTTKLTFSDGTTLSSTQNVYLVTVAVPTGKTGKTATGEFQARCQYNYDRGDMYGNISSGVQTKVANF